MAAAGRPPGSAHRPSSSPSPRSTAARPALIGTAIASVLGVADTRGIDWIEIAIQVALAAVGVSIASGTYGRRGIR